jgi:8-oxo-dGTP pyrophosphatase MutT (NUDIX family)
MPAARADAAWRLGYRAAFLLARLWWALRRPARHGVMVAAWHGGRVLVLRQSYRPGLTFPGGALRRGEDPAAAASRELLEEVGVAVAATRLHPVLSVMVRFESCRDHVTVFELALDAPPALRPDNREVVWAGFLDPAEALLDPGMPPHVRRYLEGRMGPARLSSLARSASPVPAPAGCAGAGRGACSGPGDAWPLQPDPAASPGALEPRRAPGVPLPDRRSR